MTIYYVASGSGNDSNAGTSISAPKKTIEHTCNLADNGAGNIVEIIDSSTYYEGDIDILGNSIVVRATGTNNPIMDGGPGNNDYAFVPFISGNVFQGLTMKNYDDGLINTGWNSNGKSFILSGCVGHFVGGPQHIGNGVTPAQSAVVNECKIVSDGNAVFSCGNAKVWFNNSVLASNAVGSLITSAQSYTDVTASFCTFIGSGYSNSSGRNYILVDQLYKVINCIVSGTGDGINAYDSTYNLVNVTGDPFIAWSNDSWDGTPRTGSTGEITGDPLFISGSNSANADPVRKGNVDFASQDYDLLVGSPAVGAGVSYQGILTDLSLGARTVTVDIGAYEGPGPFWTNYTAEASGTLRADFTINLYENLNSNHKYRIANNPQRPPFSYGIKGPANLRGRKSVYVSTQHTKPDEKTT